MATIRTLAAQGKVRFTLKAFRELATLGLGLDEEDADRFDCIIVSIYEDEGQNDEDNG